LTTKILEARSSFGSSPQLIGIMSTSFWRLLSFLNRGLHFFYLKPFFIRRLVHAKVESCLRMLPA
jgi:hypothetical protein